MLLHPGLCNYIRVSSWVGCPKSMALCVTNYIVSIKNKCIDLKKPVSPDVLMMCVCDKLKVRFPFCVEITLGLQPIELFKKPQN